MGQARRAAVFNSFIKRMAAALSLLLIFCCALARPALAADEDERSGLAADTLTVKVGYFGGPYYTKRVFELDELWELDVQTLDYTFIDNMPSVVITHVAGVTLADILDAAGIDAGSSQSFNFWTNDKQGGYYTSLTRTFLLDTPRYCYYSLPDNFDYDYGRGNEYADLDSQRVPTVIALADDWNRALAGASFGSDYLNLNTFTRFRLVYGQTDTVTRTASNSAKWVHSIEVTLGGAPTLTMDESALELEVGSKLRREARVEAADPLIAENAEIIWRSSDPSVAEVDEHGEITMRSEGSATITASLRDQSVSVTVSGKAAGGGAGSAGGAENAPEGSGVDPSGQEPNTSEPEVYPLEQEPASGEPDSGVKRSIIGYELSPAGDGTGGVQNWRTDEMSASAIELPIIPAKAQSGFAVFFAASLICGGAYKAIRFKKES
ncbi:MAG: Ig-like domain-containing protein [Oscillospiraceae bacterium]|jgi:hypothetical protein|nr:Ig-like domain-containing protein [Oscillospiraceae bacterium]